MRLLLAILLALPLAVTMSAAQSPKCRPHDEMVAYLLEEFKESPVRVGISEYDKTEDGQPIPALKETYQSRAGTWTDVRTNMLTQEACITDYGRNAQRIPLPPWPIRPGNV